MAQKKAHEVDAWLRRPSREFRIVLLYGPDRGLVSERAENFARALGLPLDDPFAVVRFDAGEIEQDPGRLVDEARTIPMFGGERLIWVRHASAQKGLADAVRELIAAPPPDALVLIEADDLKKSAALRTSVEAAGSAMALPCYPDEARGIEQLIEEVLSAAGLGIDNDARLALRSRLGSDRRASRGELEKLALYAYGRERVTLGDIDALSGDVARSSADAAVDKMLEGSVAEFDSLFAKLAASGGTAFPVLSAAMRQFQQLQLLRAAMDQKGTGAAQAVAAARPPVFFSRRKLIEETLRRLDRSIIAKVLARLRAAVLETRRMPDLADDIARQVLTGIAAEIGRRGRASRG